MGEVYRQVFDPVRELFDANEKIELSSAPAINDVVTKSLSRGAPIAASREAQERMFFSSESDATERLERLIASCTENAR